jgi:hypothetical protein
MNGDIFSDEKIIRLEPSTQQTQTDHRQRIPVTVVEQVSPDSVPFVLRNLVLAASSTPLKIERGRDEKTARGRIVGNTGQGALVVFFDRGQDQQQPWQVMATIDQADIRGSEPHNHDPSGAASDYARESG